ncbi:hypothetical protein B0H10DRAFT_2183260 [Mycena sp. CBHHK59/15]|nr:hypothetical protein B0H10DRAFT_2183260 [Mycena sp. CBHHK59/15]
MGVSNEQYGTLKAASEHFLNEKDFSFPHIDAAMTEIFGVDHSSKEARAWKDHFKALEIAEEKMKAGDAYHLLPVPLIDSSVVDVDVEMIPATQTLLSNDCKRAERKKNGNVHGKEKKGAGHSFDDLMASVFIERKSPNKDGVPAPIYHCIGCDTDFRNNTKKRNATHMLGCKALQRDFPATWKRFKDDLDPSVEHIASGEADLPPLQGKKRKVEDDAKGCVPIPGITTALSSHSQSQGESSGKATPSQGTLNSFILYNLVTEAENAMVQLKTLLESFFHLTHSFDGWSSRRSDEIYTFQILLLYVAVQFSMVVSDTTANIKKCHALICDFFPWILNCPDPCHRLNLLTKEIMLGSKKHPKIKGFAKVMKIISVITTFFSHSNYDKKHLKDKLKDEEDRFADQSSSVTHCLPAMEKCYSEGLIKFDTKALYNINMLLKPISRGLKTLESSQVTCLDVSNIQIGIAMGFKEVFCNPIYYCDGALRLSLPPRQDFNKQTASPLVGYLCLGIKLFSVVPSEMCDEQTASKLTAMNTAKRNNLGPENLVCCAQLNQYWRYGFGSSEVQRHCQKVWLELPTPNCKLSNPIVASIPTLQDILNADTVDQHPIDEEALFNHPDPYGIKDFEVMEEGEDDTDTAPPPLVICRANLPTLEIETYIDLNSTKLAQCFAPDQGKPQQPVPAALTKPVKDSSTKWMAEDAEWDAGAW